MLPSWLRQLKKKRFVGHGATAPLHTKLAMETLEERDVPATFFWTGLAIADAGGQLVTVDGAGNRFDNTRWTFGRNWSSNDSAFAIPQPNDDVVFPDGLPANQQPPATGSGPTFVWGTNSSIDAVFQVKNFTVLGDNFRIDAFTGDSAAPAPTVPANRTLLTITGEIRSRIPDQVAGGTPTGLSIVGNPVSNQSPLTITLTGANQSLVADETAPGSGVAAPGVLKFAVPFLEPVEGSPFDTVNGTGVQLVGLNKTGPGVMAISGSNNFRGEVTIGQGALFALHSQALGTSLNGTVVSSTNATLGVAQTDTETFRDSLVIRGDGAAALPGGAGGTAAAGTLLGSLAGVRDPLNVFSGNRFGDTGPATIDGNVNMATSATIGTFGAGITINGQVTGGPNLNKVGTAGGAFIPRVPITGLPGGQLALTNKNAYTGTTTVTSGSIVITNSDALSSAPTVSTTTVLANAALGIAGNISVPENLILNGTGATDLNGNALGALRLFLPGSQATVTGNIQLATSASIGVANSELIGLGEDTILSLTGQISSAAGASLDKVDAGIVRIPVANPNLRGPVNVRNGFLRISDAGALGPVGGGAVTVGNSGVNLGNVQGTLQFVGNYTFGKPIALNGQGALTDSALRVFESPIGQPSNITLTGAVSLGAATSVRIDPSSSLTVNAPISGPLASANLDKFGGGTLNLTRASTYQGTTTIREGTAVVTNATALGGTVGGTVVASGATLRLPLPLNVVNEQLTLSGVGVGGSGAFQVPAGTTTWSGGVVLNGVNTTEADINVADGGVLNFSGVLSGDADLRKLGTGDLRLVGNQPNQFVKTTFLDAGTLSLGKTGATTQALGGPTGGAIVIGDGIGVGPVTNNADVLRLLAPNQIPNVASIIIRESGLFDLNGNSEMLGGQTAVSLRGGEINTGAGVLTLGGNLTTAGSGEQSVINGTIDLGGQTRSFNFAATPLSRLTTSRVTSSAGEFVTFTFDGDANPGLAEPGGTVTFIDKFTDPNGNVITTVLGSAQLDVNGVGVLNTNALVTGSHEISAQYSGNQAYPPVQVILNEVQRVVNPQQRELLSSNANPATPQQALVFTYQVTGPVNTVAPTGTVRFIAVNNTSNATIDLTAGIGLPNGVPLSAGGVATISLPQGLDTGRYTITAVYSGDATYSPSRTELAPALAVGAIPTVTAAVTVPQIGDPDSDLFRANVSRSASSLILGDTVRLTFRANGSGGVPVGTVNFFDTFTNNNGVTTTTLVGSGTLDGTGSTFFDYRPLSGVGEHVITAEYGGDTTYTPNTATLAPSLIVSNPLTVTLQAGPAPVLQNGTVTYTFRATGLPDRVTGAPQLPSGTVTFFNTVNGVRSALATRPLSQILSTSPASYDGSSYSEATVTLGTGGTTPLNISADFTSNSDAFLTQANIQTLVPPNVIAPTATFANDILIQTSKNSVEPYEPFFVTVSSNVAFGRIVIRLNGQIVTPPLIDADTTDGQNDNDFQQLPFAPTARGANGQGLLFNFDGVQEVKGIPVSIRFNGLAPGTYNISYDFIAANGSPIASRADRRVAPSLEVIAPIGGIVQTSDNPLRENTPLTLTFTAVVKDQGTDQLRPDAAFATSATPNGTVIFRAGGQILRDANGNQNIALTTRALTDANGVQVIGADGMPIMVTQAVLTLAGGLTAGTRDITATYSGDTFYRSFVTRLDPAPDMTNPPDLRQVTFGGNQVQTSLTSDANSAFQGRDVTFSIKLTPNNLQLPVTGTVTFFATPTNSTVPIQIGVPQVVSGGVASVSTARLPVGVYRITAEYSGDTFYTGSTTTLTPNQRIVNPPLVQISTTAPLDPTTGGATQLTATALTFTFSSRKNVITNVNTPLAIGDVQFRIAPIVNGVVGTPIFVQSSTLAPSPNEPTVNTVASITVPAGLAPGTYVVSARYTAMTVVNGVPVTDPNYEPIEVTLSPNLTIVSNPAAVPDPTPDATIKPVQQPLARINGGITGSAVGAGAPPGVIKAGVGTLTLNGASTYTGPTVQNSMTGSAIVLTVSGALPNTPLVITSGTVDINGTIQTVASLADDTAIGGSSTAGNLAFTGGGTLRVGSTAAGLSTTYAGVMTGTGNVIKNGSSALNLTGNSGAFNGTIFVNGGTLRVNNLSVAQPGNYAGTSVAAVSPDAANGVTGGGTVGGTGTVGLLTLQDGTFVAPGATAGAVGTLNAGATTLSTSITSPVTFQIDLARAAATGTVLGDLLNAASLVGGTGLSPILALSIAGYNNPTIGDNAVTIFTVAGGLPADFRFRRPDGSVIENNATVAVSGRAFSIVYGANSVTAQYAGLDVTGTLSGNPAGGVSPGTAVTYTLDLPTGVGGTVTFTVTGPAGGATPTSQTVAVNGAGDATTTTPVTFTVLGSYTVTATYSGNATLAPKEFRLTQPVNFATAMSLSTSNGSTAVGQPVTFTATVTSANGTPTGTVTFTNATTGQVIGNATLSGGVASLTTTGVPAGTNTIQATYNGDGTFRANTATVTQSVAGSGSTGGAFYTNAFVVGNLLVVQGNGVPGGVAVIPVPAGTVALFTDLNGDGNGDVVLILPNLAVVFDGATGRVLFLFTDLDGDGRRELLSFAPDGSFTRT